MQSFENMKKAIADDPSAQQPTALEAITPASLKGAVQSGPRQRFMQAGKSLAEVFLHNATGAGFTRQEAQDMVDKITPTYLDKPENIAQKEAMIPVIIKAIEERAGRAHTLHVQKEGNAPTATQKPTPRPGYKIQQNVRTGEYREIPL
jgi:hypothetical protein